MRRGRLGIKGKVVSIVYTRLCKVIGSTFDSFTCRQRILNKFSLDAKPAEEKKWHFSSFVVHKNFLWEINGRVLDQSLEKISYLLHEIINLHFAFAFATTKTGKKKSCKLQDEKKRWEGCMTSLSV